MIAIAAPELRGALDQAADGVLAAARTAVRPA